MFVKTSCRCLAREAELHSAWCDLRPFPGELKMTYTAANAANDAYSANYGKAVAGQCADVLVHSDIRVFPCGDGCGARVVVTGMLFAMVGNGTWFISTHAPKGSRHVGGLFKERGEA